MTTATRGDARALLGAFLAGDQHYRASAFVYGDGGIAALERALDLFLARPELGFVWLAQARDGAAFMRRLLRDLDVAGLRRRQAR